MMIRTLRAAALGAGLLAAASVYAQELPAWASPSGADAAPVENLQPCGPAPCPPPPPPPVPIDGGLSLLALAGAGYAAHKLRNRKARG